MSARISPSQSVALISLGSYSNVDQNSLEIVYWTQVNTSGTYSINFQFICDMKLPTTITQMDVYMVLSVVGIAGSNPGYDLGICKVPFDIANKKIGTTTVYDSYSSKGAYLDLINYIQDTQQDWLIVNQNQMAVLCQSDRCYMNCEIAKPLSRSVAQDITVSEWDDIQITGTYFTYTNVQTPQTSGYLLWSKGTSDAPVTISVLKSSQQLTYTVLIAPLFLFCLV